MARARKTKAPDPFRFPAKPHSRIHGPEGHTSYTAYKPWLRDEFEFRCVYCLTRERWSGNGHTIFSADHVKPKTDYPELINDYNNLVYCCTTCNSNKGSTLGLPDPCKTSLKKHLKFRSGIFIPLTPQGKRLVEVLRLNKPQQRITDRNDHLELLRVKVLLSRFGYPQDLPDLSKLKPPKGNSRPKGLKMSHYARKLRGELPDYY